MRSAWRGRGLWAIAVLAILASFGLAVAEDAFLHTDDGCAVERHCATCRWHQGATPALVPSAGPVAALEPQGEVLEARPILRLEGLRPESPSRAPPLA
jgi:hypothetical protein